MHFTFCARIAQKSRKRIAKHLSLTASNLGDQGNALLFCEGSANLRLPGVGLLDQEPENLGVLSIGEKHQGTAKEKGVPRFVIESS